jgi:hypothetical protein
VLKAVEDLGVTWDLPWTRNLGHKGGTVAERWWLTPVIPVTWEPRKIMVRSQPGQIVRKTLSRKTLYKKGLVEVLSSSPSTTKINK